MLKIDFGFQVFGYGVSNETSSLDETSGADSGDDFAVRKSSSCSTTSGSSASSPSASPTAELHVSCLRELLCEKFDG